MHGLCVFPPPFFISQFTAIAGSGALNNVAINVQGRRSVPFIVRYLPPAITAIKFISGKKNESVALQITGTSMGYACTSCSANGTVWGAALPVCVSTATNAAVQAVQSLTSCDLLACDANRLPSIAVQNASVTVPCIPWCVERLTISSVSSITCRTSAAIAMGNVTVTVGGLTSEPYLYEYEKLLPTPQL